MLGEQVLGVVARPFQVAPWSFSALLLESALEGGAPPRNEELANALDSGATSFAQHHEIAAETPHQRFASLHVANPQQRHREAETGAGFRAEGAHHATTGTRPVAAAWNSVDQVIAAAVMAIVA